MHPDWKAKYYYYNLYLKLGKINSFLLVGSVLQYTDLVSFLLFMHKQNQSLPFRSSQYPFSELRNIVIPQGKLRHGGEDL